MSSTTAPFPPNGLHSLPISQWISVENLLKKTFQGVDLLRFGQSCKPIYYYPHKYYSRLWNVSLPDSFESMYLFDHKISKLNSWILHDGDGDVLASSSFIVINHSRTGPDFRFRSQHFIAHVKGSHLGSRVAQDAAFPFSGQGTDDGPPPGKRAKSAENDPRRMPQRTWRTAARGGRCPVIMFPRLNSIPSTLQLRISIDHSATLNWRNARSLCYMKGRSNVPISWESEAMETWIKKLLALQPVSKEHWHVCVRTCKQDSKL